MDTSVFSAVSPHFYWVRDSFSNSEENSKEELRLGYEPSARICPKISAIWMKIWGLIKDTLWKFVQFLYVQFWWEHFQQFFHRVLLLSFRWTVITPKTYDGRKFFWGSLWKLLVSDNFSGRICKKQTLPDFNEKITFYLQKALGWLVSALPVESILKSPKLSKQTLMLLH